jgi:hypothetical protein
MCGFRLVLASRPVSLTDRMARDPLTIDNSQFYERRETITNRCADQHGAGARVRRVSREKLGGGDDRIVEG